MSRPRRNAHTAGSSSSQPKNVDSLRADEGDGEYQSRPSERHLADRRGTPIPIAAPITKLVAIRPAADFFSKALRENSSFST